MELAGAAIIVVIVGHLLHWLTKRPQRGILLLAALVPFDGLLLLVEEPGLVTRWKEGLVVLTLAAALAKPGPGRPAGARPIPAWAAPMAGLLLLAVVSVTWGPLGFALAGLKVDFFYVVLPIIIWRSPLDAGDRDHLVTILMVGSVVTALGGIAQQLIGPAGLNRLGYEYDTAIRTTDSILRSFSTFTQPFPFAFYLVFVLSIAVPVALADRTRRRNQLYLLATPIVMAGMASAIVRAAVLALVVAGAYHVARRYREVLSVAPSALLVAALAPAFLWGAALSAGSLGERVDGWSVITEAAVSRPWGAGLGTTGAAAEASIENGARDAVTFGLPPNRRPYQPDNYYVKRLLELGAIGLWLTVAVLRHALGSVQRARVRAGPGDVALLDGITASMLGAIAAAVVATYWEIFPLDLYFWLMLGVVTSIDRAESSTTDLRYDPREVASRPTYASS